MYIIHIYKYIDTYILHMYTLYTRIHIICIQTRRPRMCESISRVIEMLTI